MNERDQELAEQAGGYVSLSYEHAGKLILTGEDIVQRFADLVRADALVKPCCGDFYKCQQICMPRAAAQKREACAKVCETQMSQAQNMKTGGNFPQQSERNFCPRCGKRTPDLTAVHTCTPPKE